METGIRLVGLFSARNSSRDLSGCALQFRIRRISENGNDELEEEKRNGRFIVILAILVLLQNELAYLLIKENNTKMKYEKRVR